MPKPLVPVAGIPLIERVMGNARDEGAKRFVANAHHLGEQLLVHFAGGLKISHEQTLLGTGGGVKYALPMLHADPFFVMNTDAFWPAGSDRPLGRMIARFEAGGADIVLLCAHPGRVTGFGRSHDYCLDPFGRVTRDYGAPVVYAGVALVAKSVFAETPEGAFSFYPLIEKALDRERLMGVALDAPWHHVGDMAGLEAAEKALA
jgi:MurNAc alpha-1-phosphate uridylyltransferase